MTEDLAAAALGVLLCGPAGLAVPVVIAGLPSPIAEVAERPRMLLRSAVVCAVVGAVLGLAIGLEPALWVVLPLVPQAVLLAIVDRHTQLIPSRVVWPMLGLAVGLVVLVGGVAGDGTAVVRSAVGGVTTFLVFHTLWWLHSAGMGYGDVRLSAVVGTVLGFLGWGELVVGVYAGFAVFALVALGRAVLQRDRGLLREPTPYGPYLLGGALVGVVLGGPLWSSLVSG
ncbi:MULTISPECIES: prepilin peptidase [unclassified Nocardioides]|uniref:prepilin peptidase n=1 Tax=unclassified Nocardioides TaxID=2615069 RepID=UPI0036220203